MAIALQVTFLLHSLAFCSSNGPIEARKGNPPVMPAVMTPAGPFDLSSVLFRNRIIFIGQPVNSQVAQRVISQLVTLATIDENSDILVFLSISFALSFSFQSLHQASGVNVFGLMFLADGYLFHLLRFI